MQSGVCFPGYSLDDQSCKPNLWSISYVLFSPQELKGPTLCPYYCSCSFYMQNCKYGICNVICLLVAEWIRCCVNQMNGDNYLIQQVVEIG